MIGYRIVSKENETLLAQQSVSANKNCFCNNFNRHNNMNCSHNNQNRCREEEIVTITVLASWRYIDESFVEVTKPFALFVHNRYQN